MGRPADLSGSCEARSITPNRLIEALPQPNAATSSSYGRADPVALARPNCIAAAATHCVRKLTPAWSRVEAGRLASTQLTLSY